MARVTFSITELLLIVTGFFPTQIMTVEAINSTSDDKRFFCIAATSLFIGQVIGVSIQLYTNRNAPRKTLRESINVVWGGALAGVGFAVFINIVGTVVFGS
jgi:hypothetical protein